MAVNRTFILYTLAFFNFAHIMDVMIMMPLGDIFMMAFSIGSQEFSFLVSIYSIGAFVSTVIGFFILDSIDRKSALLVVSLGFTIGTIACGMATTFVQLLCFRGITGLFGGIIGALALSIISDLFLFKDRGRALGILMGAFSVASALGVPFGLYLADRWSWHTPFFVVGGIGFGLFIIVLIWFPPLRAHMNTQNKAMGHWSRIRHISTNHNQMMALLLGTILVFGHFIIIPFIAPYMIRNIGFTQSSIVYIYLFGGIATAMTSPLIGRWTDRFGVQRIFFWIMSLSFIPVLVITHLPPTSIAIALIATTLFFVLGSGRMIPPQTLISATVGPETRGSFMSIKAALQQGAVALSALLSGFIIQDLPSGQLANYSTTGYVSVGVCVITLYLIRRLKVVKGN